MEQKPKDCNEGKLGREGCQNFLHGEFGERDEAVCRRRNARVKHGGKEAVKMHNGGGKTLKNAWEQLKCSSNPEEGKGRWNSVAKDAPEEWWVPT